MLRKLAAVFVYHLPPQRKEQMGPFSFFSVATDAAFMSSLSFPAPAWPCCRTAGLWCSGRRCAAGSGTACVAGEVATCPPISGLFEVTKPDIKGYRE